MADPTPKKNDSADARRQDNVSPFVEERYLSIIIHGPAGGNDSSTSKAESADSGVYTCSSPANTAQKIIVHRGWRPATKWPYKLPTEKYPK
ncbi:uncharacterized protein LOC144479034 isoform X3 [Augochlora pura]